MGKETANICATIYDGNFDVLFDCSGVEKCRFALCPVMPPSGEEECVYSEYGSCRSAWANVAALELLSSRIKKRLKQYTEDK